METVLLTGAGGFLGRHVAAALAGRARVVTPRENAVGRIDLLDPAGRRSLVAAERPDIVVHLAWVTEHGRFWEAPENAAWEAASLDLFNQAFGRGARRVVGVGSCAEYDWTTGAAKLAEDAPLRPHTGYGRAKVRTAAGLAEMAAAYGASWAWARIFFLFGPGEPPGRLVPSILRAALSGQALAIGPAATRRDIWDVRNAGAALGALALSDAEGSFNVASGDATRFGDLAATVERLAGSAGAIRPGGRPLGPGEPESLVADASRMRAEIAPGSEIGLDEGLAGYLAALRGGAA